MKTLAIAILGVGALVLSRLAFFLGDRMDPCFWGTDFLVTVMCCTAGLCLMAIPLVAVSKPTR